VLSGDPIGEVRKLRDADGGPILVNGSAQLVHALCEAGLIDEYRAMIHPVVRKAVSSVGVEALLIRPASRPARTAPGGRFHARPG
jgi:riboflavin biosynthesis pyrimidine reductase